MGMPQFGPTADGYRMSNMSLSLPIMTAYAPQVGGAAFYAQDQVKAFRTGSIRSATTLTRGLPTRTGQSGRSQSRRR